MSYRVFIFWKLWDQKTGMRYWCHEILSQTGHWFDTFLYLIWHKFSDLILILILICHKFSDLTPKEICIRQRRRRAKTTFMLVVKWTVKEYWWYVLYWNIGYIGHQRTRSVLPGSWICRIFEGSHRWIRTDLVYCLIGYKMPNLFQRYQSFLTSHLSRGGVLCGFFYCLNAQFVCSCSKWAITNLSTEWNREGVKKKTVKTRSGSPNK